MPILSAFRGLHAYTPLESLFYDSIVERAIGVLHARAMTYVGPRLRPGIRALDVGCGGGHFTLDVAAREPSAELVGLDLSPEQVERARRRGAQLSDRVSFVEGSALELPFAADSFDLVFSLGSLKHWPSAEQGLRECARVLAPGGELVVVEGDRGCRPGDVDAFIASWRFPAPVRALAKLMFINVLVPQCLDLDDTRAVLAALDEVLEAEVARAEGLPMWVIEGRAR